MRRILAISMRTATGWTITASARDISPSRLTPRGIEFQPVLHLSFRGSGFTSDSCRVGTTLGQMFVAEPVGHGDNYSKPTNWNNGTSTLTLGGTLAVSAPLTVTGLSLGSATYLLALNGSGNLITTSLAGGAVTGTGTVNNIPKWFSNDDESHEFESGRRWHNVYSKYCSSSGWYNEILSYRSIRQYVDWRNVMIANTEQLRASRRPANEWERCAFRRWKQHRLGNQIPEFRE